MVQLKMIFSTTTRNLIGQGQAQNRFIQLKLMPGVKPGIFLARITNDYTDYTDGMMAYPYKVTDLGKELKPLAEKCYEMLVARQEN